jgi:hypothetical protein
MLHTNTIGLLSLINSDAIILNLDDALVHTLWG